MDQGDYLLEELEKLDYSESMDKVLQELFYTANEKGITDIDFHGDYENVVKIVLLAIKYKRKYKMPSKLIM